MFYLNRVILAGKIVHGPEVRYTQRGRAVVSFVLRLPAPEGFGLGGLERDVEVKVMAIGPPGERWAKEAKEGRNVLVEGGLYRRRWQDDVGPRGEIGVIAHRVSLIGGERSGGGHGKA